MATMRITRSVSASSNVRELLIGLVKAIGLIDDTDERRHARIANGACLFRHAPRP